MPSSAKGPSFSSGDAPNAALWRVTNPGSADPQITQIAGGTTNNHLTWANGVAADGVGNVYVSDMDVVWKLTPGYSFCNGSSQSSGPLVLTPADGATGIVLNPVLTWTAVSGATSYDVHFGATNPPPLAGNATCPSYTPLNLTGSTTYYWQVVPKGSSGLVSSPVQSFTTQAAGFNGLKNVGSAADGYIANLTQNSIAAAYGNHLAVATANATTLPLPTVLIGTSVQMTDSTGKQEFVQLFATTPGQVNFLVPGDMATGPASLIMTAQDGTVSEGATNVAFVAPSMFQLNASGLAAAYVVDATTNTTSNVYQVKDGQIVPLPISIPPSHQVFLELFATGIENATGLSGSTSRMSASINGIDVPVTYAGPQRSYAGLDQVNVQLPPSLAGSGNAVIQLLAAGVAANRVSVTIQ
jgi:uncharacterized protein (TIGR03437 family)